MPPISLSHFDNATLRQIATDLDAPVMDKLAQVSSQFNMVVTDMRHEQLQALVRRPGRFTKDAAPLYGELAALGATNPRMSAVFRFLCANAAPVGPLNQIMHNMREHCRLEEAQRAVAEYGGVYAGIAPNVDRQCGQRNAAGRLDGFATVTRFPGPDSYKGSFVNGVRQGFGQVRSPACIYEGSWHAGRFHGRGITTWPNGEQHEGEHVNGHKHGEGVYSWPNGDRYEGAFANDSQHGQGVHTSPDGTRYQGTFLNGRKHGDGVTTLPNGERREKTYVHGQEHGLTTTHFPDGSKTEVQFEAGVRAPTFVHIDAQGVRRKRRYPDAPST